MNINHYKKIYKDLTKYILGTNEFSFIENYQEKFLYPINLDFTLEEKEFYYSPMDENGIPYKIYSSVGKQYNPTRIAAYGLSHYNDYMQRNNKNSKEIFLKCLDWFFINKEARYEYNFDWNDLKAPWISCLAQAEAISILLRGYYLTNDEKYLRHATKAMQPFFDDIDNNGLSSKINDKYLFLEEYPSQKPQHVLNGFLYALIAINEYKNMVPSDSNVKKLYDDLTKTLVLNLDKWDSGTWSFYEITNDSLKNYCTPSYHNLHITQLKFLQCSLLNKKIEKQIIEWEKGRMSFLSRMTSLIYKVIFRIKNKAQR